MTFYSCLKNFQELKIQVEDIEKRPPYTRTSPFILLMEIRGRGCWVH